MVTIHLLKIMYINYKLVTFYNIYCIHKENALNESYVDMIIFFKYYRKHSGIIIKIEKAFLFVFRVTHDTRLLLLIIMYCYPLKKLKIFFLPCVPFEIRKLTSTYIERS